METSGSSPEVSGRSNDESSDIPVARKRIARIRCFLDCVNSIREKRAFPEPLCYVPSVMEYAAKEKTTWKLYAEPTKNSKVVREISATIFSRLIASGEDMVNSEGKWLRVTQLRVTANDKFEPVPYGQVWFLLYTNESSTTESPPAFCMTEKNLGVQKFKVHSWQAFIEETYSLRLKRNESDVCPPDGKAVAKLRKREDGWTMDHDAALIRFMSLNVVKFKNDENVGCLRNYVESLDVSSFSSGEGEAIHLTDDNPETYWETDGAPGRHWIRLHMKKNVIIKSLVLKTDHSDLAFLPEQILILGGDSEDVDFKFLHSVDINWSTHGEDDVKLLENCTKHYPIITISFKKCRADGIDVRIRGIEMVCGEQRSTDFHIEFFSEENLVKFPILQSSKAVDLYHRSIVLNRFIWLLDSVIHFLVPVWQHSIDNIRNLEGSCLRSLENVRQLLPLSKKRLSLINTLLKSTATDPEGRQVVHLNRHAAHEHRRNPQASSDYSNTVFMQLYEGMHPKDRNAEITTYRWKSGVEQWWECKFISEGVIDQGGGFRDSLTDMAEELCPSDPDAPSALPYFIRAPNQENEDGNTNKDYYVPNPGCTDFSKYEWIGQLMAACFRTTDILVLPLAPFIWKKLSGESYNWSEDFSTVDTAEVKLIDNLSKMDRATFDVSGRSWSIVLSDGSPVTLKMDQQGNPLPLAFDKREEYADKVREIRMGEFDKQIKALRNGLLKALPDTVLNLSTWQELELGVCGEPDVTVEGLMRLTYYSNLDENDAKVKMFWAAVKNFTNDERSRLLRFITGRSRLPVSIFLSSGKTSPLDQLPESSTCANTIHIPSYSTAQACEEKLKYAIYNCVSIDTDE